MFWSAGNPYVAAAKANIWSQSTQDVLDSWDPFDEEDKERKDMYKEELDGLDSQRDDPQNDYDDPGTRKKTASVLKKNKIQIKRLHETVVYHKTESDRKRRKRGGNANGNRPEHYMQGVIDSPDHERDGIPPSPESEMDNVRSPPQKSKLPFNFFGKKKPIPPEQSVDVAPRHASYDESSPRPMAIMNEPHPSHDQSRSATYPRHRGEYDPARLEKPHRTASYRDRDRHASGDDSRRRDDRDRSRRDYDKHSQPREVYSTEQPSRHRSSRSHGDDQHYRHQSSRRRYSEDDAADPDRERRQHRPREHNRDRDMERDRDRDRDRDRNRDRDRDRDRDRNREKERGEHGEPRHRRHRSEGHRSRKMDQQPSTETQNVEEPHALAPAAEDVEERREGPGATDGDVLSVSEQLHGTLNVGDS